MAIGEIDLIEAQLGSSTLVIDDDITLSDVDGTHLDGAEVRLSGVLDGADEILSVTTVAGINASYAADGADMVMSLTGNATLTDYEQVLESLTYNNTATSITAGQRSLQISITDETGQTSEVVSTDINVLNPDAVYGTATSETLQGDSNNNLLYGEEGDDILYGDDGLDVLYGGTGQDTFVFEQSSAFNDVDIIHDFDKSESDAIDISDLLGAYDPLNDAIADFISITQNGSNSLLAIDQDGTGTTHAMQDVVQINNTANLNINDMISDGELIIA